MIPLRSPSVGWRGVFAPSSWRVFSCAECGNLPAPLSINQRSNMKPLKNEPGPEPDLPPAPNPPKPDPPMPDPPINR